MNDARRRAKIKESALPPETQGVLRHAFVQMASLTGGVEEIATERQGMFVNARAIIERDTPAGTEMVIQVRNKPREGGKSLELPGGRVDEFESLIDAVKREVREETGLTLTHIEGIVAKVNTHAGDTEVECVQPFAVYQTTRGPVDSMGVYFRCQGEGSLLEVGDDTLNPQWVPIDQIAEWMEHEAGQFGWIDQAGLLFYLKHRRLLS